MKVISIHFKLYPARETALLVGKPQSTIAGIENGNMNLSIKVLSEIAEKLEKTLTL